MEPGQDPPEEPEEGALDASDLDLDLDLEAEAEEDAGEGEGDGAGEGEGEGEGEGGAGGTEGESEASSEEEDEPGDPNTKVPTKKQMLKALAWAFEGEELDDESLLDRYAEHAILMLEANKITNLTAIQDPKEVAAKHYLDSWRLTRLVPLIAKKVLDLGTGAGFPGLPVAMAEPNCSVTLVDSTRKKVEALQGCIETLGVPNAKAVWARAEDHLTTEKVDIVLVRAVSSIRENVRLLRKVRHSLQDYVMLKGKTWSREVRAAEREAERLGFKLDTVWEHELPGEMGQHAVLVYRAPGGAGY